MAGCMERSAKIERWVAMIHILLAKPDRLEAKLDRWLAVWRDRLR
jgi:hypothetical protein